ncbi:glycerol dehydrogenase [compost metagenome]
MHHPDILHGEIIAFTTLVQLLLEDADYEWYLHFLRNLRFHFDIDTLGLADEETIRFLAHHFVAHFTEEVAFFITDLSEERVVAAIKEAKQILVEEVFSDG